jgi:hypothetical protein
MTHTAYLHVLLDTRVVPPVVVSASTFSDQKPTNVPGFTFAQVDQATGASYGEAKAAVIAANRHHAWLQPLLGKAVQ